MRGSRTLRSRLFSWFFGAIVLTVFTSAFVVGTTRPEGTSGVEAASHHMATRLASIWDDDRATAAYVDEVRDVTGFEVRLLPDGRALPAHVHRIAERGGSLAPAAPDRVFVPIVRGGTLVGALEMNRFGMRPAASSWWRLALALFAVMAVLSVMARRVAHLFARPLERLAYAADRFGSGDLAFRAEREHASGWVAREVREVAISFNRMADRVEAMVRGQRELLGAISHELRSPLGRARVALEIVRDRAVERIPPESRSTGAPRVSAAMSALADIDTQLVAIDAILGDLLDIARVGLADLHKETRDLVEWLGARAGDEPPPPAVALHVAPATQGIRVSFDAAMLGRVVHNLLVNARAHGHPPDRPIEMRVTQQGDVVRVTVRDHGPGFAQGFAERAFEPFVRGDVARTRPAAGAGYGLGLTLVRRIVDAHGGRVFARNADDGETGGAGAEVGFDLPIAPSTR
ncbi:MAG: ATP-binding protein [Myxococcota bacterium]|nr:ATP-binding protein [Myxococcota bacterium]